MNLLKIKDLCERKEGGLKRLAEDIGMSEQNLHRCINLNKMQAGDLEKVAITLGVSIGYFLIICLLRINPLLMGTVVHLPYMAM
ncbi:helix-turn-helix domain-containing protein [Bacteroides fragilis]